VRKVYVTCRTLFLISIYAHKLMPFSVAHRNFYVKTQRLLESFAGHHNPSFLNVSGFDYHHLYYVREMLTYQRPRIKRQNFYCNTILAESNSGLSWAERNRSTSFTWNSVERGCFGSYGATSVLLHIMNSMAWNHGGTYAVCKKIKLSHYRPECRRMVSVKYV